MKIRYGFISNSSSTAFIITNITDNELDIVDFVKENEQLVDLWNQRYGSICDEITHESLIESAKINNDTIKPGEQIMVFGDSDETLIGRVFDYILRDGGSSRNFSWRLYGRRGGRARKKNAKKS